MGGEWTGKVKQGGEGDNRGLGRSQGRSEKEKNWRKERGQRKSTNRTRQRETRKAEPGQKEPQTSQRQKEHRHFAKKQLHSMEKKTQIRAVPK